MKSVVYLALGVVLMSPCGAWERAVLEDVTLEYRIAGKGHAVVFIHGALVADGLEPLARARAIASKHRVLDWHRVGYAGSSPASGRAGIATQAAQLARLMRHLGLQEAHVVGHSSGGLIALQLALDHPELTRSLVLLEPALNLPGAGNPGIARAMQIYGGGDPAAAADTFMRAVAGEDWRLDVERALPTALAQAMTDTPTLFEHELPAVRGWQFGAAEAQRIRVPVLAVMGGASPEVSPTWQRRQDFLASQLPDVETYVLPRAKHWLALQDPNRLARRLAEFFARHP